MMGRPDILVIGRLLEALALAPEPMRRTPLQQRAGLNYTVFQRYFEFLERQGLLVAAPGDDGRVTLTPKGREAYRFLEEGLDRILGPPGPVRGTPGPTDRVLPTRSGTS